MSITHPPYASWINQVETWFPLITQKAIRRGTFKSVKELASKIDQFVANYHLNTKPFVSTATDDLILEKIISMNFRDATLVKRLKKERF